MNGMNKVFLMGYLGQPPESRTSTTGKAYTVLNLATHRRTQSNENEAAETKTQWFQICVWGKQAETCTRYLEKGQGVMVEGYLNPYQSATSDGQKRYGIAINASHVEFLPRTKGVEFADHRPSS